MKSLAPLSLIAAAVFAQAQAGTISFDWEDIQISNDADCGKFTFEANQVVKNLSISLNENSAVSLVNTTVTNSCKPPNQNTLNVLNPFGFATAGPNVAVVPSGSSLAFQLSDFSQRLSGNVSFSVGVQLNETELHSNHAILISTMATDFGLVDERSGFTFVPSKNGAGPYEITLEVSEPYILFEIQATIDEPVVNGGIRVLTYFVDNVIFETTPAPSN
ncbi:hypothetical protein F5884DRAFT_512007 [Xylogone sp. PMI_703]|nr:hypothetical protein F5884DRAFT_512007 [Xylogone sp. PMI_703]